MRTYKKKRSYEKASKGTHKKHKKRTKKRKTKKKIKGGEPTPQELESTTSNFSQMMNNPQMVNNFDPQMMNNPQMVNNSEMVNNSDPQMMNNPSNPQMMNSQLNTQGGPPEIRLTQTGNVLSPRDGISNRGRGILGDTRDNFMKTQQNIALVQKPAILSHQELMDYLADFKNQIKEIINIDPDEDKDISDTQAKKIIEAISSHRAKIGGLQHTLYRQNKKIMNEIESEKRRLEAKFSNLEKKIEKEIKKLKRERSPRGSPDKSPRRSPDKSPRRSSDRSPRRSPEKSPRRSKGDLYS